MPKGTLYKLPIQVIAFENEANLGFRHMESSLKLEIMKKKTTTVACGINYTRLLSLLNVKSFLKFNSFSTIRFYDCVVIKCL